MNPQLETAEEAAQRQAIALANLAEIETDMKRVEVKELQKRSYFWRVDFSTLIKAGVAGISLAISGVGYFQYIYLPSQNHSEMLLIEHQERHKTELARAELIKEAMSFELEQAISKLKIQVKEDKRELRSILLLKDEITDLKIMLKNKGGEEKVEQVDNKLKVITDALDSKIALTQSTQGVIEENKEVLSAIKSQAPLPVNAWIYVGYYPNEKWNFRTLNLQDDEMLEVNTNKTYIVNTDVNVYDEFPKFRFFRYQFGDLKALLLSGQKVKILDMKEVGLSKVWAKVQLVPTD